MIRTPPDLAAGGRGRGFWRWINTTWDMERNELALLHELCRTMDRIDALDALVVRDGLMVEGSKGQAVLHPAVSEARMQRQLLRGMLAQLELPEDAADGAGGSNIYSLASVRGTRAAHARWRRAGHGVERTPEYGRGSA